MAPRPSPPVLEAFGVKHPLRSLPGGRGLCFEAGGVVLRPSDDDAESEWTGNFISSLSAICPITAYRLPHPIKSTTERPSFVHEGWTASTYLTGYAFTPVRWGEVMQTCRHFHADVRKLNFPKPDFLSSRLNRFHEADLVTWDEKRLSSVEKVNEDILAMVDAALRQLEQLKRPLPDLPAQIIHGDLTGNILFDEGSQLSPGIIDLTVYWRPAEYAEAIIVADGLVWHGQGEALLSMFSVTEVRLQLLVRALYWRCLCFAIDPDMGFVEAHIPKTDFQGAALIVKRAIDRLSQ